MKKLTLLFICMLVPGIALAFPFGSDNGTRLQGVLNDITLNPTNSTVNVTTDYLADGADKAWAIGGSGGAISTLIIELAGFAPDLTFGIYDTTDQNKKVQLFGGSATPGSKVEVSIWADGSVYLNLGTTDTGIDFAGNNFGFYLTTPEDSGKTYYSNTLLNPDSKDHMLAYQGKGDTIQILPYAPGQWGPNEWILAWEDLFNGGDLDYEDFVVLVESVNPVPEPVSMLLFGTGLVGIGGYVRRKFKK